MRRRRDVIRIPSWLEEHWERVLAIESVLWNLYSRDTRKLRNAFALVSVHVPVHAGSVCFWFTVAVISFNQP